MKSILKIFSLKTVPSLFWSAPTPLSITPPLLSVLFLFLGLSIFGFGHAILFGSNFGVKINKPKKLTNLFKYFFGEDQSRYVAEINTENLEKFIKVLEKNNVFYEKIGETQKDFFEIKGELKINIKDLYKINNQWYNNY